MAATPASPPEEPPVPPLLEVTDSGAAAKGETPPPADLIHTYYRDVFPWTLFGQWLAYARTTATAAIPWAAASEMFARREFSFTLESGQVTRHNLFHTVDGLQAEMQRVRALRLDIGATTAGGGRGLAYTRLKELIFDIDLTDYDDVRSCGCRGDAVCSNCWHAFAITIKILDCLLRRDFGFQHLFWVFSGRRGAHCWVCDPRALRLSCEERTVLVDYVHQLGVLSPTTTTVGAIHPSLWHMYKEIIEPRALGLSVSTRGIEDANGSVVTSQDSGVVAMDDVQSRTFSEIRALIWRVWPRLDSKVTKQVDHLLKAPWAVHPKTGKICVPIDPDTCETADPTAISALSVQRICREVIVAKKKQQAATPGPSPFLAATSLQRHVDRWNAEFLGPLLARPISFTGEIV